MVIIGGVMSTGDEIFGSLYEKGTIIFHQNDPGDAMYIIQSGAVEISHTDENGRKRVLALLEKGDFFGEIALFQDVPRSATVTAIKKTRLLPFTKNSLLKRIQTDPGVALHLMTGLVSYIQWANQKYREMVEADDELRDAVTTAKENGDKPGIIRTDKKLGTDMEALSSFWNVDDQIASFPKGHTIFKEGDPSDSMYIILGGTVEISLGEGDDHQVIAFLGEGDFFGEMAIISGDSRSATVKTLKETRLLPIGRETFTRTISQSPELALYIIGSLTSRLKQHEAFLADPGDSFGLPKKQRKLKKPGPKANISWHGDHVLHSEAYRQKPTITSSKSLSKRHMSCIRCLLVLSLRQRQHARYKRLSGPGRGPHASGLPAGQFCPC